MLCPLCGTVYPSKFHFVIPTVCKECYNKMTLAEQEKVQKDPAFNKNDWKDAEDTHSSVSSNSETDAIFTLKLFAWLDLIASFGGAIWIWSEFGKRVDPRYSFISETNPVGIAVGIAVILQGMFVCVFFLVVASIAENLIAIRKNTKAK